MIEKIKGLEYSNHFYKTGMPATTPENLKIIVDKINEIIEHINKVEPNINPEGSHL